MDPNYTYFTYTYFLSDQQKKKCTFLVCHRISVNYVCHELKTAENLWSGEYGLLDSRLRNTDVNNVPWTLPKERLSVEPQLGLFFPEVGLATTVNHTPRLWFGLGWSPMLSPASWPVLTAELTQVSRLRLKKLIPGD